MLATIVTAMLLQAAASPPAVPTTPSAEADTLGRRLAATGTLAALLPLVTAKESEEMVAAHPELSDAEKAELRATAKAVAASGTDRVLGAEGKAYAAALSLEDLKILVAAAESPAGLRQRKAMPKVIGETLKTVGTFDFKKETLAAFCQKTGKACEKK